MSMTGDSMTSDFIPFGPFTVHNENFRRLKATMKIWRRQNLHRYRYPAASEFVALFPHWSHFNPNQFHYVYMQMQLVVDCELM